MVLIKPESYGNNVITMATIAELKSVLKESLEKRGVMGQLKARIRAEIFSALDDQNEPRPVLSHENLLINELILEYLEYNKYKYTASVLKAESGQPEVPLDRQFLTSELNVVEDSSARSVPLLYGITSHFMNTSRDGHGHGKVPQDSSFPASRRSAVRLPGEGNVVGGISEPGRISGVSFGDPVVFRVGHR
ncbi:centrosomal protein 20 isoform X2 [Protopterus annectens]|uniref:centrosomal protein 20 isoform X2 n=1 Tax=Protopterus annectens TaxID=7888 RepID=UPI001CFABBE7|nr:centrosomal protein 20 isoform X2 [Protopterus annectens]